MGKRELVALLNLSSWCLVMVERLFLAVPRGCLRFVIVVFPDHTHYFYSVACVMPQGWDLRALGVPRGLKCFLSNMVMWDIKLTGMTSRTECK